MEDEIKVQELIATLNKYGGFDDWWENIVEDDQAIILEDLKEVINNK